MPDSPLRRLAELGNPANNGRWIIAALEGVEESSGTGRFDPGWFHPSALGDDCDAKLAFQFLGAPAVSNIAARSQRIFDLGTARDEWLRDDMQASGLSLLTCEEDRYIEIPDLRIHGEIDDIVKHPVTNQVYIVDYKTMRSDYWEALEVVVPHHHIQVHPYMAGKGVRHAYVLYENKNTQEFKIKKADWDQAIWNEIGARIIRILVGLEHNYVNRNPVNCSRCPFYANSVCLANDIAGLKARSGLTWLDTFSTANSMNTPALSSLSPSESSERTEPSSTPRTLRLI